VTLSTLARCMTVQLRDGTVIGMSDHDAPLSVEVPGLGPVIQRPNAGLVIGDVQISVTLDSGNTDVTCPLSAYVGRTQVVGRRFNHARPVWAARIRPSTSALATAFSPRADSTASGLSRS
jgi:hypothetical protein